MKIALIGYGKMGKAIESIVLVEKKHEIVLKISKENKHDLTVENLKKADVAIEFTEPEAAYKNIQLCFEAKIPVVIGTTAWMDKVPEIQEQCLKHGNTCMVSSNYSIGVNLFFSLSRNLGLMMKNFPEYHASIREIHHIEKKDAPSGTAVTLANDLVSILEKNQWKLKDKNQPMDSDELSIESIREPNVPGTHSVIYSSMIDEIEIIHTAKSRAGFALGAIKAAEFIHNKKGFFTMHDLFNF